MQQKSIQAVLEEHVEKLMSLPGVVGTGQGERDGKPCISVFVVKASPEILKNIPPELRGYPVDVRETGEFKALGAE